MVPFGDWLMPMEYSSGALSEHAAVRGHAGLFDVSHMGRLRLRGAGVVTELNRILTNDLNRIGTGRAQYTLLCNESGGVVDDLICYRLAPDDVLAVPNASNASAVRAALRAALPDSVELLDLTADTGMLALQGPASRDLLVGLGITAAQGLPYLGVVEAAPGESGSGESGSGGGEALEPSGNFSPSGPMLLARSGYTGELGYELFVRADRVAELWQLLVAAGAKPAGLAARDILRLEMGYPLHGNDLSAQVSALECGLAWAIGWDKPAFIGRAALLDQRAAGTGLVMRGLRLTDRGVPRQGMPVRDPNSGQQVGVVTSGTFSPVLRGGIALARLDSRVRYGDELEVVVRGRPVAATTVRPPFIPANPRF